MNNNCELIQNIHFKMLDVLLVIAFNLLRLHRILDLSKDFPKGIPDKIVRNDMPCVGDAERAAAINNLVSLVWTMELFSTNK